MSESLVIGIVKEGVVTAVKVSAPILATAMVIGLLISILQATTQIQEQTLTFVPKVLGAAVIGILLGNWMLHNLMSFTERIFELIIKIST
ncbi:MAG: flagellar biosynthesis protein FliQ [Clostridium sp.]|uniref:flagellar biosynthesis protein FliQ n=1 Tax=Clostridium sp. DSM 8431 TaxID=1761781 RepID=UPI0008E2C491|nr:flagellar biosynthesis protein FliQ [Clostridium sp. DSM 8431]MCR4944397.1 flagellar biosynthesis protein FliQ [Clostridium sp.]SFU31010.1 flagellar biosynthetic protein FliQ [Clostridium sp. DSM 8431]